MALIKITQNVIKPNENYDTNNIDSTGIITATQLNVGTGVTISGGIVTATSFSGDGSGLSGIDATTLKDSGGTIRAQANTSGVVVTGVVTATSFSGNMNATGLTGTPDIDVRNITGVAATFTGNVSIAGTLTYEDVTNIDSVGLITARSGINVTSGNSDFGDFSTFGTRIKPSNGIGIKADGATAREVFHVTDSTDSSAKIQFLAGGDAIFQGRVSVAQTIAHAGDTNTFFGFPADDIFAVTNGGTQSVRIDNNQRLQFGADSAAQNFFNQNGTFGSRVTSELSGDANNRRINFAAVRNTDSNDCAFFAFGKSRGTSSGAVTVVQDDDRLGHISFQGADGTNLIEGAAIRSMVDGSPGGDDIPGRIEFHTNSGSANASERIRIDSSGRLLVGETSSTSAGSVQAKSQVVGNDQHAAITVRRNQNSDGGASLLLCHSRGTSNSANVIVQDNDNIGSVRFFGADATGANDFAEAAAITVSVDGTPGSDDMPGRLEFKTAADGASSPTERMRITEDGRHLLGGDSSSITTLNNESAYATGTSIYHVESANSNSTALADQHSVLYVRGYGHATNSEGANTHVIVRDHGGGSTSPANFMRFYQGTGEVLRVEYDGDVKNMNNSYGSLSDQRLKENIVDAESQWDDIKALKVRKYNFKDDNTDPEVFTGISTHTQMGVVAQEVELVSPGLVNCAKIADGSDDPDSMKTVKYSVLYMKAVKALQEAMTRIETLEAKVAALEGS